MSDLSANHGGLVDGCTRPAGCRVCPGVRPDHSGEHAVSDDFLADVLLNHLENPGA